VATWKTSEKYDLTGIDGAKVFRDLPEGAMLRRAGGSIVEILENARDGATLLVRVVENEADPSSVGEEEYVFFADVQEAVEEGA
jgi:hypothetical protein